MKKRLVVEVCREVLFLSTLNIPDFKWTEVE
jgi:hypothetical protein